METENTPTAQGTEAQAPSPNGGVEKRIDELTAKFREAEREVAAAKAQNEALLAELLSRTNAPAPAAPVAPRVEIDPHVQEQFNALMGPMQAQFSKMLAELQKSQAITEIRTGAARAGLPDEVAQEAEKIAMDYARQGYAIKQQEAYDMAAGRVYMRKLSEGRTAGNEMKRFNGDGTPVITQNGAQPNLLPQAKPDFDSMSLDERIAAYEAAGVGRLTI